MARITEFRVGSCRHPECAVVKGGRLASREFPARAYLIESGGQKFLWDTGYASHFFAQARGVYRLYSLVTPVHLPGAEDLQCQLRQAGVDPAELTALVLSHFHADHVAGVADFPGVPVLASQQAWDSIAGVSGLRALLQAHIPGLVPSWVGDHACAVEACQRAELPAALQPFTQGRVLDEAGDVVCVPLPGHAKGHLGAFVRTNAGWELLASDAAWDRRAYEDLRGPSELSFLIQDSRAEYYETLRKLQQLHREGVRIRLSHEPWAPKEPVRA